MAGESFSWYSISASASAEPQSKHQCTGFTPRVRWPLATILASARISLASKRKSRVLYGLSQSPITPRRLKSLRCRSICDSAYSRHFWRNSTASSFTPTLPYFFSMAISIGRPWQSQPGMYGASKPARYFDLTMMSLRILLTAWPRWIAPLAYGGPSCSTNSGRPLALARSCAYRPSASQRAKVSGSRLGRSPRIGKSVAGRWRVAL